MQSEKAQKLTEDAFTKLSAALEAGKSDTLTALLKAAARFPHYSFRNVMLIVTQFPEATRVCGFNAWKKLGRFVKKGEHGIVIVAPMPIREREENTDESRTVGLRFRGVCVFDVSQTDGAPLPELAEVRGDPGDLTAKLKSYIASLNIALDYADDLGGPDGMSQGGHITLRRDLAPAEEFSVLVHELAHETLHHIPRTDTDPPRPPKVVRETEAEAVAFVVTHAVGLDTGTAASDYIQLYQGDKDTLATSLARIQAAASGILAALLESATEAFEEATAP
jgi:N-terminal domain of anti-restriction factor ArdC